MHANRTRLMMLGTVMMRASSASVTARPVVVGGVFGIVVGGAGIAAGLEAVSALPSCTDAAYDRRVPTVFTRIIRGEIPGSFVWRDDECVAFMSINPINTGHTLVVPVAEVDHWIDLPASTAAHLMEVAHAIGRAQQEAFLPERVGMIIAGFEVPHTHLHVIPMDSMRDLDFANAATEPNFASIQSAAAAIKTVLVTQGASGVPR
jgi:histidine triad (HIT) family protein